MTFRLKTFRSTVVLSMCVLRGCRASLNVSMAWFERVVLDLVMVDEF
jgi:hypothetical protein